jgi:hypothetical protein
MVFKNNYSYWSTEWSKCLGLHDDSALPSSSLSRQLSAVVTVGSSASDYASGLGRVGHVCPTW